MKQKINWKETGLNALLIATTSALGAGIYEITSDVVKSQMKKRKAKKSAKASKKAA